MLGDDDVVGGEIETPIALMIRGVFEEDITGGPGAQFVGSLCGEVEIIDTTENTHVLMGGCNAVKSDIWVGGADCLAWEVIQQVHSSVERFDLVASRHRGLK
jgi:hypothetical protein